jgi:hypothetical protein
VRNGYAVRVPSGCRLPQSASVLLNERVQDSLDALARHESWVSHFDRLQR